MKPSPRVVIGLVAAIGTLPFLGADRAGNQQGTGESAPIFAASLAPPATACQLTAAALRIASIREAQDDYWVAVAKCRNGPGVGDCIDDADDDLDDALDLVDDQYEARLALCPILGQGKYDPVINPGDFSANVNNPFLPLIPGRVLTYHKMTDEGLEEIVITHSAETIDINGVQCRVVTDVVTLAGVLVEDTVDWFTQKGDGTVWYMGEIAKNFEDGVLDNLDGSWRFGKEGAKPGIVMLAMPFPGAAYRVEFDPNNAEDVSKVISLNNTVTVMAGTFTGCLEIEDSTPLEPDHKERKFYAPGVGMVKEVVVGTGEVLELVSIMN